MAALVQSFPPQTSTVTMLQTRPSSASGTFQNTSQGPALSHHVPRPSQTPRTIYSGNQAMGNYRGQTSHSVAPYAFTATPGLSAGAGFLPQPHLRLENRTASAPTNPYNSRQTQESSAKQRAPSGTSISATPTTAGDGLTHGGQSSTSKDDSVLVNARSSSALGSRPASAFNLTPSGPSMPNLSGPAAGKTQPDRYRRNHRRAETNSPSGSSQQSPSPSSSAGPSGSGMANVGHLYSLSTHSSSTPSLHTYQAPGNTLSGQSSRPSAPPSQSTQVRKTSVDDMHIPRQGQTEQAKRYRRRSISSLDTGDFSGTPTERGQMSAQQKAVTPQVLGRPNSSHGRSESGDSAKSGSSESHGQSRPSSIKRDRETVVSPLKPLSANPVASSAAASSPSAQGAKVDHSMAGVPPRLSSDANKRLGSPSPLSKPTSLRPESPLSKHAIAVSQRGRQVEQTPLIASSTPTVDSPAAQHLAALTDKDGKKGKKSRLKRAFSFGSAAELRRASAENNMNNASAERAKLRKERYQEDQEAEQEIIAQKQEASGLGESIYSGQGNFFTGSTDNLSISSTASSASIMIRKMGKGMKKSTRSLVGLFRPKSIVGAPEMDTAAVEPTVGQISMVTVEAEREKVNVNANPHDQVGGGTGYPKLERNSLDAAGVNGLDLRNAPREGSHEGSRPRRSIVGGERERAEVLAAVKKGILKRNGADSGSSSPVTRPADTKSPDFNLPQIPHMSDSPLSSAPSTPRDERQQQLGHRRTDSVTIEGEDYFMHLPKFNTGESKSAPNTPHGGAKNNVSFSPRIQFHDTWQSQEYDRRGEIATCNRLTPMLAQQIKEELNTFKMEMEVHEQSKVYTHFF
ncbi:MAG: hypothetical protein M1825_000400 [Sarcosagium campestre]|nr:MAG: hypothetical protein M1825_000400 [Sarcosagium campestre]